MRLNSLAVRLIAAASLWSAVALVVAGLILTSLYRQTVEQAFDERLGVYLTTLIGNLVNQDPSDLTDPGNLGEQRFELLYSGWYWQVSRADGGPVLLASSSLFSDSLDFAAATERTTVEGATTGSLAGPNDQSLRLINRTIIFDEENRFDVLSGCLVEARGRLIEQQHLRIELQGTNERQPLTLAA